MTHSLFCILHEGERKMRGWGIRERRGKHPIGDNKHLSNARPRTFSDYQRQVSLLSQGSLAILLFLREDVMSSCRRAKNNSLSSNGDARQVTAVSQSISLLFSVNLLEKHHDLFGWQQFLEILSNDSSFTLCICELFGYSFPHTFHERVKVYHCHKLSCEKDLQSQIRKFENLLIHPLPITLVNVSFK